jgi:hypothetical protein
MESFDRILRQRPLTPRRDKRKDQLDAPVSIAAKKGHGPCKDCLKDFPHAELTEWRRCPACDEKFWSRIEQHQERTEREQLERVNAGIAHYDRYGNYVETAQ